MSKRAKTVSVPERTSAMPQWVPSPEQMADFTRALEQIVGGAVRMEVSITDQIGRVRTITYTERGP